MIQRRYYKTIRVIVDSDGGGTPFYIENIDSEPGYFTLTKSGSPTHTPNLNYRIDNGEWFEYDTTTLQRIEVPAGSKIYLKGDNPNGFNIGTAGATQMYNYYKMVLYNNSTGFTTRNFNLGGYITSLLAFENFNLITTIPYFSFNGLFKSNTGVRSSENIITENIITIQDGGFRECFSDCTSLTTAPLFENVISAGKYAFGYQYADTGCFNNCKSLVTAPTFENLTNAENYCFGYCFNGCTSLVTAPKFDKVILNKGYGSVGNFLSCFNGCTSLVTAPTFDNVILVGNSGFSSCFRDCTSLVTAPKFDKVTTVYDSGFNSCFNGCTSLVTAPTFENVNSLSNSSNGYNQFTSCFKNCSNLTTPPIFGKLTRADKAFLNCFEGCSSLITTPNFRSVTSSYGDANFQYCFKDCTSLETILAPRPSSWTASQFTDWVINVPSIGTFYKKQGLDIPAGTNGIPEGWTVIEEA